MSIPRGKISAPVSSRAWFNVVVPVKPRGGGGGVLSLMALNRGYYVVVRNGNAPTQPRPLPNHGHTDQHPPLPLQTTHAPSCSSTCSTHVLVRDCLLISFRRVWGKI